MIASATPTAVPAGMGTDLKSVPTTGPELQVPVKSAVTPSIDQ
jgi:hypothetical protein